VNILFLEQVQKSGRRGGIGTVVKGQEHPLATGRFRHAPDRDLAVCIVKNEWKWSRVGEYRDPGYNQHNNQDHILL
jgi:hypothetical protein